jgi:flagellar biosynthesis chaperone FliJ
MNYSKWTGWRQEEVKTCKNYTKKVREMIKDLSDAQTTKFLSSSYLMRDLCVAYLDKTQGKNVEQGVQTLNKAINQILKTKKDYSKVIQKNLNTWANGYNSVQCYLTPKALLYTARGDYAS